MQEGSHLLGFPDDKAAGKLQLDHAKVAHLPPPSNPASGLWLWQGSQDCSHTHKADPATELHPQTAGAPFSCSSSLVPSNVKAYHAHFKDMLTGILCFNTKHVLQSKFVAKRPSIAVIVGLSLYRVSAQMPCVCPLWAYVASVITPAKPHGRG